MRGALEAILQCSQRHLVGTERIYLYLVSKRTYKPKTHSGIKTLMKASKLLWAVVMALTFVFTSCDPFSQNEPTIEGDRYKYFDSSAQRQSFRVVNGSGKPYNHKVDWHIIGILEENSDTYLTKKVDTLSNGDFRISYDWVTFTVKENKSVIDVEVQKNETGKDRSVFFATSNSYKQAYHPNMIVTQRAK